MRTCVPTAALRSRIVLLAMLALAAPATAQVHYFSDGWPWTAQTSSGPDAIVPGWFYNLGITGIRIELVEDAPKEMVVRYVFAGSPAHGIVRFGDHIVGAGGQDFVEPHQNGYGVNVFGAQGPVGEFAVALEAAQSSAGTGVLEIRLIRNGTALEKLLDVGQDYGAFSPTYPEDCPKSDMILSELLDYLVLHQGANGSWGNPVNDLYASLALLAAGDEPAHLDAARSCVQYLADTTAPTSAEWLPNWRYMTAGIVLSEYYLATGERWVPAELEQVRQFLDFSQYTHISQLDPMACITHPSSCPQDPLDAIGGWGHNPGFEGYGPIAMLTGEGALAYALMSRCGMVIDWWRQDLAYEFLARGTGANGYLWYADEVASDTSWADQGRTGASALANWLVPTPAQQYPSLVAQWFHPEFAETYRLRALHHIEQIGAHPESFPDTHGSPILGMGFVAAATSFHPESFRSLMDANRWWFALAQCTDGSYYYQPNRDNAGYGADSRTSASAVTAFILSIPRRSLVITGKP
ncbi:MAG: DUF6288 domain-containing protein [Planctomycetota bacterium]|jgi:hypothetical protein